MQTEHSSINYQQRTLKEQRRRLIPHRRYRQLLRPLRVLTFASSSIPLGGCDVPIKALYETAGSDLMILAEMPLLRDRCWLFACKCRRTSGTGASEVLALERVHQANRMIIKIMPMKVHTVTTSLPGGCVLVSVLLGAVAICKSRRTPVWKF